MSKLSYQAITMPAGRMEKACDYPLLYVPEWKIKPGNLDESDELFLNYGRSNTLLPFSTLSEYDHTENPRTFHAFTLENDYLKAVFLPEVGGKMWSLYDKVGKRDLIVNNPVFRPCNVALCNAWTAGGVEWNCGVHGHHPLTCDKVYAASYTAADGTPVLRIYAFERVRAITYQIDFFLPNDSRNLYARMRLVNESDETVPIYWWTNIAVEQKDGSRVIAPATEAYVHQYGGRMGKQEIPVIDGIDRSYPTNEVRSIDYFYKIPDKERKFEAYLDRNGVGLIHASTARLKGRKLFAWGTCHGGMNWQRLLTNKQGESQPYVEIQAGLTSTQWESVPFPSHSAWEWIEAFCPAELPPEDVHGDYQKARFHVENWLDKNLPQSRLDNMLEQTREEALRHVKYTFKGYPWGTLDNELRKAAGNKEISPNLDFGEMEPAQELWSRFLKNGYLDEPDVEEAPASFMVQDEWFEMLRKTVRSTDAHNWFAWYQLGLCWYARREYGFANAAFEKSIVCKSSTWAYHALACTCFAQGKTTDGAGFMVKALERNRTDLQLAKEALRLCAQFGEYNSVLCMHEMLPSEIRDNPRIQATYAAALAHTGELEKAKEILEQGGGLRVPDILEGELSTSNTYIYIIQKLAERNGCSIPETDIKVPNVLDYRMSDVRE